MRGRRQARDEDAGGPGREDETDRTAGGREQQSFDERLTNQPGTADADGDADRQLAVSDTTAREEEIGDSGACDEKEQADEGEQEAQRIVELIPHPRKPGRTCLERRVTPEEARPTRGGLIPRRGRFEDLSPDRLKCGVRLATIESAAQAAHDVKPSGSAAQQVAVFRFHLRHHRDRDGYIRRCADSHAKKAWRRHTDDGERYAVDGDRLADSGGIAAVMSDPGGVAQHGDWMRSAIAVVVR